MPYNLAAGLREPGIITTVIRLVFAIFCGGIIGLDRGRRRRPAGFRTHMLVAMGAALTMLIGQYVFGFLITNKINITTDVSRFGAQVISGIGFLGAGTIIVTSRQEIKGLTTAAGLWASACMGLAIGAGFYLGAICACFMIFFSVTIMRRVESLIMQRARNMNLYIEVSDIDDIGTIIDIIKADGIRIYDFEINKDNPSSGIYASVIFSMQLPSKMPHADILTRLADIRSVRALEEI